MILTAKRNNAIRQFKRVEHAIEKPTIHGFYTNKTFRIVSDLSEFAAALPISYVFCFSKQYNRDNNDRHKWSAKSFLKYKIFEAFFRHNYPTQSCFNY